MSDKQELNSCENCNLEHKDEKTQEAVKVRACQVHPDCDIEEAKEDYVIRMDMPGLDPAGIDVKLDKDILTVEAKAEIEGLAPRRYYRQFRVMRGLDAAIRAATGLPAFLVDNPMACVAVGSGKMLSNIDKNKHILQTMY